MRWRGGHADLNLLVFALAYSRIGAAIIHVWGDPVARTYDLAGYGYAFGLVALLQLLAQRRLWRDQQNLRNTDV